MHAQNIHLSFTNAGRNRGVWKIMNCSRFSVTIIVFLFQNSSNCGGRLLVLSWQTTQITKFMAPTWGPGSCRPQMGPMLAPWTLLSGCNQCVWGSTYSQHQRWKMKGNLFLNEMLCKFLTVSFVETKMVMSCHPVQELLNMCWNIFQSTSSVYSTEIMWR